MSSRLPDPTTALVEPEFDREAVIREEASAIKAEAPRSDKGVVVGPEWKRVVYRGRVISEADQVPVPMAVVSVFEGGDRLFTTLTDEQGRFELPAKLYGLNRIRNGESHWRPESYYRIEVDAGEVGESKKAVADIHSGDRLVFSVG
ncbi:MAG: carboxypeptidase regulatory-like domain-containing protein [Candidatus Omnitrophica bacterium]|nr:carboxypeptidase regulatory-like domain-containing protein [Candidatus Omnitrophota bacterium]